MNQGKPARVERRDRNSDQRAGVALLTGAAKRIGRSIAEDLAAHGFDVVLHCHRSRDEADAAAAAINSAGGRAAVVQADLTDMTATAGVMEAAARPFGPIDLLVNSASIFEPDTLRDFGWDTWDRHFAIHVKAPCLLARHLADALPAGRPGLVVNIVDQRVLKPTPAYFSYALSKSALWAATRTMAQELGPKRIRVNAIGPGPTLPSPRQTAEDFAAQVATLLLERGPSPGEIGATVRYLWNAPSVTGQLIAVDGGQHLAWRTPDVTGIAE